jgi:hypothetical protein
VVTVVGVSVSIEYCKDTPLNEAIGGGPKILLAVWESTTAGSARITGGLA